MASLDIFRIIAVEFDYLDDTVVNNNIELVEQEVTNPKLKTETKEKMIAYLTAHYLTVSQKRKGAGGEVSAISEGQLSIQYATGYSNIKSDLAVTSYGRVFDRLARSYSITPLTRWS